MKERKREQEEEKLKKQGTNNTPKGEPRKQIPQSKPNPLPKQYGTKAKLMLI